MGVVSRRGRRAFLASLFLILQLVFGVAPLAAQEPSTAAPPAKVQQLIRLLDDPEVRQWLASKEAAPPAAVAPPAGLASQWIAAVKRHLDGMRAAAPRLVPEWQAAKNRIANDMQSQGTMPILRGFAFVLLVGYGAEVLLRYFLRRSASRYEGQPHGLAAFVRVAPLVVFAIAATIAFVLSDWPRQLETAVAPLLVAWIVARLLIAIASATLKPADNDEPAAERREGKVSLQPDAARFWYRRSVLFICALAFLWAVLDLMRALSFPPAVRDLMAAGLGLVVLCLAIDTTLRRPVAETTAARRMLRTALIVAFLTLLWFFWVAGMKVLFWIGVYVLGLPPLLRFTSAATRSMLDAEATNNVRVMRNVLIDRGARFAIIALAAAWLALVFQINGTAMMQDDVFNRIFRGVLAGVVILLAADLIWQLTKECINLRMNQASIDIADSAQLARNTRLRTLLPILRNFLAAFIAVVAGMMVLSGLGVAVGPLIAGAGVFGVAIGFGSQTLVKDIISGIFYMMDDAFRVGEYIQSGSYKGTVESFSIRSVKLRHHRGPIFTVPFGSLGAVQNMSRDWVIDKFLINVSFDTDVAKVKKVVKGVGAALLEDPDLGPLIIETVKMKGVEQFGDYGMTLSFAMTTKPGHQTQVRRRAQALIKEAFKNNGIHFASPTVQVAGDETQATAAAAATRDAIAKKNAAAAQGEEPTVE
ncbi:mechanosensitive ion channel family protein [Sinorhizobium numidicum]|uniref:Mechanosensitive ion channel family protein n=1 Tax=Sinorhizobium numidicum TaxID=680248 RepID=A0ABY8CYR9_9HYPH|nr:mechanosensitive ion channel family protein [Sinorhizobium numidicum]WEX77132.1 mechanosensitive ion channel family protein [Sinorhizobium numidicum]WEX83791.1 mechanosensitive ion channel family protein [Sinorhizobium numidicum]